MSKSLLKQLKLFQNAERMRHFNKDTFHLTTVVKRNNTFKEKIDEQFMFTEFLLILFPVCYDAFEDMLTHQVPKEA